MNPVPEESFDYSISCRRLQYSSSSNPKSTITFHLKRKTADILIRDELDGSAQTLIQEHQTTYNSIALEFSDDTSPANVYTHVCVLLWRLEPRFRGFLASVIVRTAEEFGHGRWGVDMDVDVEIRAVRFVNDEGLPEEEEEENGAENRGTGVSEKVMKMLKRETRFHGGDELNKRDDKECSICLESLSNAREIIQMPCSHIFHQSCIFTWLRTKNTCPICRQIPFSDRSVARR